MLVVEKPCCRTGPCRKGDEASASKSKSPSSSHRRTAAFSLLEVVFTIFVLAAVAVFLLPTFAKTGRRSSRLACINNVKQISLGFRMWANDEDRFPWNPPTNAVFWKTVQPYQYFQSISNEVAGSPKLLACPSQTDRQAARDFAALTNNNLGYFICLDAVTDAPALWLIGDRTLTRDQKQLLPGLVVLRTNEAIGWTKEEAHKDRGNVGLVDGSAGQLTSAQLSDCLQNTKRPALRLLIP